MKKLAEETIINITHSDDYILIATADGKIRRFLIENLLKGNDNNFNANNYQIKNLAEGSDDNDAVTISQLLANYYNFWYGVEIIKGQTSSELTPIGDATMLSQMPVHAAQYSAVINEAGEILQKIDKNNITLQQGGGAAIIDGTLGDAMRVFPEYYFKFEEESTKYRLKFSPYPIPGFEKKEEFAVGIYNGDIDSETGKLRSRSGVYPTTSKTRAQFRTAAALKGNGWSQIDLDSYTQIVFLAWCKFANLNSQTFIGAGCTNANSTDWSNYNSYNPIYNNGEGDNVEIENGEIPVAIENFVGGTEILNTNIAVLFQIRDIFGHIYHFTDGINIHNSSSLGSRAFKCLNPANFADNTETNYELIGNLAELDGYISKFIPGTILPIKNMPSGSSSQHCGDYYYSYFDNNPDSGWRVLRSGGYAFDGSVAGLACANANSSSGNAYANIGSRLCLKRKFL